MKKQNIEDIFSSMEGFSSVPPPELWGEIEKKLDKPKKKKRAILWWSAAACLLLGLLLPSVLHFYSDSGIKNINNGSTENNSVVLDEKNNALDTNKSISTDQNNIDKTSDNEESSSTKDTEKQINNSKEDQNQETAVAHADSNNDISNSILNQKSNTVKGSTNQSVAEKTAVSEKENSFNPALKHQLPNSVKKAENQAVAEKTFVTGKENQFNAASKYQISSSGKKAANQAVAEKTFVTGKENQFNSASKYQISNPGKKAADKILAEKTFSSGKTNGFNSGSQNQLSNSIFEEKAASKNKSNNNSLALNPANSGLNNNPKFVIENKAKQKNDNILFEKAIAGNPIQNSKSNNALSKQDSVQLAELQNLEKGIASQEVKKEKEKEINPISNPEKWDVQVFAGVASSENYKNDKTLGNANDSKQGNTYGVKTKYKINKKWAVGSGIKINELGQSVANIAYINSKNNPLTSNDYFNQNETTVTPQIASNRNFAFISSTTVNALKVNNIQSDNVESGNLDQNLRYLEMPLEVSYSVFSKNKASISLNTGGFVGKLISNNVALNGNSIGDNINANDYVYGSTLSSTVQYRVYKKTNVFVEPAMNYYINPMNNQSFNQFQWGLNFGLNVSF